MLVIVARFRLSPVNRIFRWRTNPSHSGGIRVRGVELFRYARRLRQANRVAASRHFVNSDFLTPAGTGLANFEKHSTPYTDRNRRQHGVSDLAASRSNSTFCINQNNRPNSTPEEQSTREA